MSGPLAGVKVLDLSRYQNGPHATLMMADYGADILKLEHTQVRCALSSTQGGWLVRADSTAL